MLNKKILIIEDDVFLGDVIIKRLQGEGYEAYLERDGAVGFQKIKEHAPHLILLDIMLPTMNGYEILEAKQKDEAIAGIPVIIISNSGQPVEINRALALGIKDYVVKADFDPSEVIEKVNKQLGTGPEGEQVPYGASKKTGDSGGESSAGQASQAEDRQSSGFPGQKKEANMETGANGGPLAGKSIMWVEDDKFLSDLIARRLSSENSKLIHSSNAEDALKLLQSEKPDIILLDILLSGMDGFECLKKIRSQSDTKDIPVILLSNLGQKSDIDKGKELGAEKFLVKATVTLDEIVEEVKVVLAKGG